MATLSGPVQSPGSQRLTELIDIMAASDHPGPLELYAAAARKTGRDLLRYPEIEQAVVLACSMSEKVAELVLAARRASSADAASTFARLLQSESSRLQRDNGWAPPGLDRAAVFSGEGRRAMNTARRLLPEELLAAPCPPVKRRVRKDGTVDWQGSWASLWEAGARLLGVAGDDPSSLEGAFAAAQKGDAAELAHALRREIFIRSARDPDSVFTLALYAYQTMLVHRPEAYALASVTSPAVSSFAQRVAGIEGLLAWMRKHVQEGSIFCEPDRVMLAGQSLEYGLGRALDRALLIFAVLRHKGYGARIVRTTRGVYTLACDLDRTVLIDAGWLVTVERPEGVVVLAFDDVRQYGYREAWQPPVAAAVPVTPSSHRHQGTARRPVSATVA